MAEAYYVMHWHPHGPAKSAASALYIRAAGGAGLTRSCSAVACELPRPARVWGTRGRGAAAGRGRPRGAR